MLRHLRSASAWLLSTSIVLSTVASPQPGSAASNAVTDVSYGKSDGVFTVSVAAAGSVRTHVQRLSVDAKQNLQDLVVDVSPASYDGQTRVIGFSSGTIRQVRFGQLSASPAIMRIVVEAHGAPAYDLKSGQADRSVTLRLPTSQVAYTLPPAQAVVAAREAQSQKTSVVSGSSAAPKPAAAPARSAPAPAKPVAVKPAPAKAAPVRTAPAMVAVAKPAPAKAVPAKTSPAKPAAAPVTHSAPKPVAPKPVQVAYAAPAPAPTQNPWLPGGKFYCKV